MPASVTSLLAVAVPATPLAPARFLTEAARLCVIGAVEHHAEQGHVDPAQQLECLPELLLAGHARGGDEQDPTDGWCQLGGVGDKQERRRVDEHQGVICLEAGQQLVTAL